ncbi:secreted protein [Sulfitobacter phage phiCB2047-B]|uniref:Uncharacterized protein n=1 Tax=Sulfitobacter phage phiCB2047-B TaxID=754046 RepID=M4PN07_9CAUD|nr:secreted protein [Sulfitobacter phage phiCB2047-B]AGH07423.1 hypothetical protein SUFG_00056 [Sulfitobacter phage phiCB2047-B]
MVRNTLMAVSLLGFVALVVTPSILIQRTIENTTIEVQSKERLMSVSTSEGNTKTSYKNFVYSDDETYIVKDSLWNWHFRAATVYAKLPNEGTCDVTLSGVRWGFLSMNQNIIAADCR